MSAAATSIPVYAQCEVHAVIHFLHSTGETPISINRKLCQIYGTSCMSLKNFENGVKNFQEIKRKFMMNKEVGDLRFQTS
jgi:hypothetical protein